MWGDKMSLVSIRGAITAEENTREAILEATKEMLEAILKNNKLNYEELIQLHFSCTKDLDAAYPAVAARQLGITDATLMCFQEMYVVNSLNQCIRVDILVNAPHLNKSNIKHQYLRRAVRLRPDLVNKE